MIIAIMALTRSRVSWLTLSLHVAPNGLHGPGTQGREGTLALDLPSGAHFQPCHYYSGWSCFHENWHYFAPTDGKNDEVVVGGRGNLSSFTLLMFSLCVSPAETSAGRMCICFVAGFFSFHCLPLSTKKKKLEAISTQRCSSAYQLSQGLQMQ